MRVFLAGATGAIGRPLVGQLTDAGHDVTGITRSPVRAAALEQAGAHAVVCDALLTEPLAGAMADAKPEVVIQQLTALPDRVEPRRKDLYEPTNQLRPPGPGICSPRRGRWGPGAFSVCRSRSPTSPPAER